MRFIAAWRDRHRVVQEMQCQVPVVALPPPAEVIQELGIILQKKLQGVVIQNVHRRQLDLFGRDEFRQFLRFDLQSKGGFVREGVSCVWR